MSAGGYQVNIILKVMGCEYYETVAMQDIQDEVFNGVKVVLERNGLGRPSLSQKIEVTYLTV